MAYSRWSNSRWYTYWSSSSSSPLKKITQVLRVHGITDFNYAELKKDKQKCLDSLQEICRGYASPPTAEDIEDMSKIFDRFIADVDKHFQEKWKKRGQM